MTKLTQCHSEWNEAPPKKFKIETLSYFSKIASEANFNSALQYFQEE